MTARQDLSGTEKERPAIATAVQNVLLGGHVAVWGLGRGGGRIPRGFLSNVSAAGQRGDMVSGAWEWPARDGFISAPLSCQNSPKSFHSSLTYVRFTSQKAPKFRNQLLISKKKNQTYIQCNKQHNPHCGRSFLLTHIARKVLEQQARRGA